MIISNRLFFVLLGSLCFILLSYGYYLQFVEYLEPCPMCIFQRLCYVAAGSVAIAGAIHAPQRLGTAFYIVAIALSSVVGAAIAGRQTWLQHLPSELIPECGPDLEFMLEMYPLLETIERALSGTGDCAEVSWTFLNLSIAEWSLACFTVMFTVSVWQLVLNQRRKLST